MKRTRRLSFVVLVFGFFFTGCEKNPVVEPIVVDAGVSQNIQLPVNTVTLNGTVTSGLTAGTVYLWTLVSGPGVPVFNNHDSAITSVKNLIAGTYTLQFQATNNFGNIGLDTTSVTVKPAIPEVIDTLVLQPAGNQQEYDIIQLGGADYYTGYNPESDVAGAWTTGGQAYNMRILLKFDLSSIPANADIISANLYLYSNPTPDNGNQVDANYGADNSMVLQQITAPWDSTTVSWSRPPTITTATQIQIPSTTSSFLDLNLDLKTMVASMISQNANYGFYMKLNREVEYTDRCFVSSYNPYYPDKHPKIIITYKKP